MMAFAFLPPQGCIPYEGALEQMVDEASDFILRGIGMSAAAIAASNSAEPLQPAAE